MFEECPMCGNPSLSVVDNDLWEAVRCKRCGWESFDDMEEDDDYDDEEN
jgi:ribosomal protein L37E